MSTDPENVLTLEAISGFNIWTTYLDFLYGIFQPLFNPFVKKFDQLVRRQTPAFKFCWWYYIPFCLFFNLKRLRHSIMFATNVDSPLILSFHKTRDNLAFCDISRDWFRMHQLQTHINIICFFLKCVLKLSLQNSNKTVTWYSDRFYLFH